MLPLLPESPLDVEALTLALMQVESTSGREGPIIQFVETLLKSRGWLTWRIPVDEGRDTLLARCVKAAAGDAHVTLSTHLDTVPPFIAPHRDGSVIRGRGACDAKGIAAAMVCAAERLRDEGTAVALLFVIGEETSHDGARAANASPLATSASRVLINGEPTESALAVGTKGALRVIVRTSGRAAHSAYPHLGRSATADLVAILAELGTVALPTHAVLGDTTVNIGMLAGGVADNVVAPSATARLMARLVVEADETLDHLRRWIRGRAEMDVSHSVPPMLLSPLPGYPTAVVAYATDVPNLTRFGRPYLFGPGSITVAHTDDEFIDIAELRASVDMYTRLAQEALRRELV
jgi:acetylornithine deacetylase